MYNFDYLAKTKALRNRQNLLMPKSYISPLEYTLRWVAVFWGVTPEESEYRAYALKQAYIVLNGMMGMGELDAMLKSDTIAWRRYAIAELSKITHVDSVGIQKHWGRFFETAPAKLYGTTMAYDKLNRIALFMEEVPNFLLERSSK